MSKVQITAFTGEYYFLSNYCTCPITIDGLTYRSAELIEGNTWNDNYWGMCGCTRCRSEGTKGLNKLGKILMAERARLQAATPAVTEEG